MEEEPEIEEPTPIEQQLNTETSKPTKLNKNGKPRKQLSPEALERLAKAREKANAMRQQQTVKKLEQKVEKIKKNQEKFPEEETNNNDKAKAEVILPEPEPEPEIKDIAKKPRGKKKTKIIIEQSSDDSDEFEPNDNVVFVKRVSRRGKRPEPAVEPVKEPKVEMELPPTQMPPPKPPRPELTPEQRLLKSQYEGMFGGSFMNNNLMRRHY
tara:strand:- start:1 stop:633 length:633 start_codon:yes stop_codon:yes gene_type:complete